jgi:hypothetical protein
VRFGDINARKDFISQKEMEGRLKKKEKEKRKDK